jgi:parallel beta-helix repeat protein
VLRMAMVLAVLCAVVLAVRVPVSYSYAASVQLRVHNIDSKLDYSSIQEAINATQTVDGNTIVVDSGTYFEHVIMNKRLKLVGAGQGLTIVDGNGTGTVISVNVDNSRISGFTLQNGLWGVNLNHVQNATVENNTVLNCSISGGRGIFVWGSDNCTVASNAFLSNTEAGVELQDSVGTLIINNNISSNMHGIYLLISSIKNLVDGNIVRNNPQGIVASFDCNNNTITDNSVTGSSLGGIVMGGSLNNSIYHNNVFGNSVQAWVYEDSINLWDNGAEGNFWGGYAGTDLNEDGIGDSPMVIDVRNQDRFPLMAAFSSFNVVFGGQNYRVTTICNSTISGFAFNQTERKISFNVSAADGTIGFCRILFPKALIDAPYTVSVNYLPPRTLKQLPTSNSTDVALYFTYFHGTGYVQVASEFSTFMLGSTLSVTTLMILFSRFKVERK